MLGDLNMKSLIWTDADKVLASSRYRLMNPAFYAVSLNCSSDVSLAMLDGQVRRPPQESTFQRLSTTSTCLAWTPWQMASVGMRPWRA